MAEKKEVKQPKNDAFKYINACAKCAGRYSKSVNAVLNYLGRAARYKQGGMCYPSYEQIMGYTSMSHSTVSLAIKEILKEKLWSHKVRFDSSSIYYPNLTMMHKKRWMVLSKSQLMVVERLAPFVGEQIALVKPVREEGEDAEQWDGRDELWKVWNAKHLSIDDLLSVDDDKMVCTVLDWHAEVMEAITPKPNYVRGSGLMDEYPAIRDRYMATHKDAREHEEAMSIFHGDDEDGEFNDCN